MCRYYDGVALAQLTFRQPSHKKNYFAEQKQDKKKAELALKRYDDCARDHTILEKVSQHYFVVLLQLQYTAVVIRDGENAGLESDAV